MKYIIYALCIPIKLVLTICFIPLMALAVALEYSLDGDNDTKIALDVILDIWR